MTAQGSIGARIGMLVFATSGIQFANGFFGTFVALRVVLEDFDATLAGLVPSSYFAGFTVGAHYSGPIIERFGHISPASLPDSGPDNGRAIRRIDVDHLSGLRRACARSHAGRPRRRCEQPAHPGQRMRIGARAARRHEPDAAFRH